jgi:polysaccharide export outer membrane protein
MNHRIPSANFLLPTSAVLVAAFFLLTGCSSTHSSQPAPTPKSGVTGTNAPAATETVKLREGDVLRLTFPGAANLNTPVVVRRDGKISPPLISEVQAAGLTPDELKKKLVELYKPQLLTDEVNVEVQSSTFPVFVTGAVIRPGKVISDHPMTVLESVMEAGGFDYNRANLKGVKVTRTIDGRAHSYKFNLKAVLDGTSTEAFYVKPGDIIFVPDKFSWF